MTKKSVSEVVSRAPDRCICESEARAQNLLDPRPCAACGRVADDLTWRSGLASRNGVPGAWYLETPDGDLVGWICFADVNGDWTALTAEGKSLGIFPDDQRYDAAKAVREYAKSGTVPPTKETTGGSKMPDTSEGIQVKLNKTEMVARHERLLEVDSKLLDVKAKKALKAREFNDELKGLRAEQETLISTLHTGFETRNSQTEAYTPDGTARAPKGTTAPKDPKAPKRGRGRPRKTK